MSFTHFLKAGQRMLFMILPEVNALVSKNQFSKNYFHTLSRHSKTTPQLLETPSTSFVTPVRGMKARGRLQLRCKDCYMVVRHGMWYVMCKTHPRHKQQKKTKKEESSWILTHATQHKIRPW